MQNAFSRPGYRGLQVSCTLPRAALRGRSHTGSERHLPGFVFKIEHRIDYVGGLRRARSGDKSDRAQGVKCDRFEEIALVEYIRGNFFVYTSSNETCSASTTATIKTIDHEFDGQGLLTAIDQCHSDTVDAVQYRVCRRHDAVAGHTLDGCLQ